MGSVKDAERVERRVLAELVDFTGRRVLEVGCGDGRMTWLFAHDAESVLGVDPDEELIADARAAIPRGLEDSITFRVAEMEALEIPPPRFDIAFLSWSL
ncbi:MAG TPA: class I SAM-dependent methyltransferase [Gaiellaceae bacterium]|nr:class I SAM-dependent methyltransferase [Gaiellaceae bacterium]